MEPAGFACKGCRRLLGFEGAFAHCPERAAAVAADLSRSGFQQRIEKDGFELGRHEHRQFVDLRQRCGRHRLKVGQSDPLGDNVVQTAAGTVEIGVRGIHRHLVTGRRIDLSAGYGLKINGR
jgi:hypothetical protein